MFLPVHERDTHSFCDGLAGRRKLSLRREFSPASSQHLPRCRWGGAVAVLADGLDGKIKKGEPLSSSFPIRSSIYIVEKYIQLYIVYDIQEPLGILLKREHNVYLSSSKEVEVVSWGCWAEQPQLCSSSLFGECHFSYSPESESEWRSRAKDGSADR